MKKLLSILICAIVFVQGYIFGMQEPIATINVGNEKIHCFHCVKKENLQKFLSPELAQLQAFDVILDMITERQQAHVKGAIEYLRTQYANKNEEEKEAYICKYFLEGEADAQSYIRKYYTDRYENFVQGESQLLVAVNAMGQIRGIFFFTIDLTFNNALLICGESLIGVPKELTFTLLPGVWNIIAQMFCPNSQVLILGVPKVAVPMMDKGFIQPAQMKPCEYTGNRINCEIYEVFERVIERE